MTNYMQRARAAHAAAEAATDPRDKAAYRGAAKTWERLANPSKAGAFSMQPYVKQMAALKRDISEAIDAPASTPAPRAADVTHVTNVATARQTIRQPVTIDF